MQEDELKSFLKQDFNFLQSFESDEESDLDSKAGDDDDVVTDQQIQSVNTDMKLNQPKSTKLEGQSAKVDKEMAMLRPLKFKLHSLQNSHLRYEVIYKNLLRDLRKFFIADFN